MWVFTSAKRSMGRIGTSLALLRAKLHCDKDNGRRGEMLAGMCAMMTELLPHMQREREVWECGEAKLSVCRILFLFPLLHLCQVSPPLLVPLDWVLVKVV